MLFVHLSIIIVLHYFLTEQYKLQSVDQKTYQLTNKYYWEIYI